MLDGLLGTRLLLLAGATVPLPAGPDVMQALSQAVVREGSSQGDGFELTFTLSKGGLLDYTLLSSAAVKQFNLASIAVLFGVVPEVLINGVITHQEVQPSNEPGASTLQIKGYGVNTLLDLEEKSEPYPNQPDWVIAEQILWTYAQYGVAPMVVKTPDVPIELFRVTWQNETDLAFLRRLATRNGYVFTIQFKG